MEIYDNKSLDNLEGELWLDIVDFEKMYQISNKGRVKSLSRTMKGVNKVYYVSEKILSQVPDGNGYLMTTLSNGGKYTRLRIHALVGKHFIPNPNNYPCLNHLNGIVYHNYETNLNWVTYSENSLHAFRIGINKGCVAVNMLDYKTKDIIKRFHNAMDAVRWLKKNTDYKAYNAHIIACCKGKRNSAYGYKWEYLELPKED